MFWGGVLFFSGGVFIFRGGGVHLGSGLFLPSPPSKYTVGGCKLRSTQLPGAADDQVFDLLANGAHIYFCGLKGMIRLLKKMVFWGCMLPQLFLPGPLVVHRKWHPKQPSSENITKTCNTAFISGFRQGKLREKL